MATYGSFHAMNPMASGQQTFDAGVKEGIRRVTDGDYPRGNYTRAEAQAWRDDALDAAAEIVKRYPGTLLCVDDILALKHSLAPNSVLCYSVKHHLPVCDLTPNAFGCAVDVWLTDDVPAPVPAFYGVRQNADSDPHPHFYYEGRILEGVTHWRYREEPENKHA